MKAKLQPKGLLTVGLITKNEEKNIQKCLECLMPLKQALGCRILVGDTGSSDNTVAIARQYADEVFSIEWNNDFAAARNAVIARANSQWYLSVDADEWLEDCTELVDFFQSGKYKEYQTAVVMQKNYTYDANKPNKEFWDPFFSPRLFSLENGNRFVGKIHESIHFLQPFFRLNQTQFIHYGYYYANPETLQKKRERNEVLLLAEIEKQPNDMRLYSHALDTPRTPQEGLELAEKVTKILEETPDYWKQQPEYSPVCVAKSVGVFFAQRRYEDAVRWAEILETQDSTSLLLCPAYYWAFLSLSAQNSNEKAMTLFWKYANAWENVQQDNFASSVWMYSGMSAYHIHDLLLAAGVFSSACFAGLSSGNADDAVILAERRKEVAKAMALVDPSLLEQTELAKALQWAINMAKKEVDCLEFAHRCQDAAQTDKARRQLDLLWEQLYLTEKRELVGRFSAIQSSESYCLPYYKIAFGGLSSQQAQEQFEQHTNQIENWNDHSRIPYLLAMEKGWNLPAAAWQQHSEGLLQLASVAAKQWKPFYSVLPGYLAKQDFTQSVGKLGWGLALLQAAFAGCPVQEKDDPKHITPDNPTTPGISATDWQPLAEQYVQLERIYLENVFNPELLNPEDLSVLPPLHRFGYWFVQAWQAVEQADYTSALKLLAKALTENKELRPLVQWVQQQIDKMVELQDLQSHEFQQLAVRLKEQVKELVALGHVEQAQTTLESYLKLAPQDKEAQSLLWVIAGA